MNKTLFSLLCATLLGCFCAGSRAQTTFPESEPNGQKSEATPAVGMTAGDQLTGTSTGFSSSAGNSSLSSADTFRIKVAPAPLGIYRHKLRLTTAGPAGHGGLILGVDQFNGVIQTTEAAVQFNDFNVLDPENAWYGFGKQEELYYRVEGSGSTSSPYSVTLTTAPVTPVQIAGSFVPGTITVTTVGQGHTTDTEIYVYDGALNPVPLGHNDGLSPNDPTLSRVSLNLSNGTYYVAVSTYNTANDQSDLNPTEFWDSDPLLDFPNLMVNNDDFGNSPLTFSVTDGTTTTQVPAVHTNSFDIVWATFTVGTPSTVFCSGDGTGTACPCGNVGAAGNGCGSSVSASGAHLAGSGVPSISADTFVLTGTALSNSSALYFQGTLRLNGGAGLVFGDGLRCVGGAITRLGTKISSGGTSSYPAGGDSPISIKGANSAGSVRQYQAWYRNAAVFCTPNTFNLTNGLEITWSS